MPSDIADVLSQTGLTPNEDNKDNALLGQIDGDLYIEVIEELKEDYNIELDALEVADLMEANGIDFGFTTDYTVADLIAEILQTGE